MRGIVGYGVGRGGELDQEPAFSGARRPRNELC